MGAVPGVVIDEMGEVADPTVDAEQVERGRTHEEDRASVSPEETADLGDRPQRSAYIGNFSLVVIHDCLLSVSSHNHHRFRLCSASLARPEQFTHVGLHRRVSEWAVRGDTTPAGTTVGRVQTDRRDPASRWHRLEPEDYDAWAQRLHEDQVAFIHLPTGRATSVVADPCRVTATAARAHAFQVVPAWADAQQPGTRSHWATT